MARTKKAEIISENDAPEMDAPPENQPILVKKRLHQEWVEPMPPRDEKAKTLTESDGVLLIDESPEFISEPEDSPFEELLKEVGASGEDIKVTVWELPNYRHDGNASIAHAETVFCGSIPIPQHFRTKGELLQLVQEKYAKPGQEFYDFALAIRGRRVKRNLPVVRIRPIAGAKLETAGTGEQVNALSAHAVQRDPLDELERNAKVFERMKKIFAPEKAAETVIANGHPLTTEAAILKLISDDPEQVQKIASKFIGGNDKGDSMPGWLAALLPILTPILTGIAAKLMAQQAPDQPQPAPVAGQIAPPPEPQIEPPFVAKYRHLIGRILYGLENGFAPDFIGEEIGIECERDAQLDAAFDAFAIAPTAQVKAQLASLSPQAQKAMAAENANEWLAKLQVYLRGESEAENGG